MISRVCRKLKVFPIFSFPVWDLDADIICFMLICFEVLLMLRHLPHLFPASTCLPLQIPQFIVKSSKPMKCESGRNSMTSLQAASRWPIGVEFSRRRTIAFHARSIVTFSPTDARMLVFVLCTFTSHKNKFI